MLEYEPSAVIPFMQSLIPGLSLGADARVIGWRRRGELIAGVAFEGFNGQNLWIHVSAKEGSRWLTREYLSACFRYAFEICGVQRLSGYVNASNEQARRFDEHLGFREEARLRGAAPDGGDVIIYVMWREQCRYLGQS